MLRSLIEAFENRVELPIEISEIRDVIIAHGFQDKVILAEQEMDTGQLKGVFYQWIEHGAPYAEPTLTTLVIFPSNVTVDRQRLICAKELTHVCDLQVAKTNTPEAVLALAEKLVGPFEAPGLDAIELMASVDKLAQFQGLNLLLPKAARNRAKQIMAEDSSITPHAIADWAVIPVEYVTLMLSDFWDPFSAALVAINSGE